MQIENRDENKWMFDFDVDNITLHNKFMYDIPVGAKSYKTPHGYAIVTEHGFDTRELMKKWKDYDNGNKRRFDIYELYQFVKRKRLCIKHLCLRKVLGVSCNR